MAPDLILLRDIILAEKGILDQACANRKSARDALNELPIYAPIESATTLVKARDEAERHVSLAHIAQDLYYRAAKAEASLQALAQKWTREVQATLSLHVALALVDHKETLEAEIDKLAEHMKKHHPAEALIAGL
jgi:D-alanyl-D-alanine dipeptidase